MNSPGQQRPNDNLVSVARADENTSQGHPAREAISVKLRGTQLVQGKEDLSIVTQLNPPVSVEVRFSL